MTSYQNLGRAMNRAADLLASHGLEDQAAHMEMVADAFDATSPAIFDEMCDAMMFELGETAMNGVGGDVMKAVMDAYAVVYAAKEG